MMWSLLVFLCATVLQSTIVQVKASCPGMYQVPFGQQSHSVLLSTINATSIYSNFDFSCTGISFMTGVSAIAVGFTPSVTAAYLIRVTNCQTFGGFDPAIKVIQGTCKVGPTIFCNDDLFGTANACSGTEDEGIVLQASRSYTIVISELHNSGGPIFPPSNAALNIEPALAPGAPPGVGFNDTTFTSFEFTVFAYALAPIVAATSVVFVLGCVMLLVLCCYCRRLPTDLGEGKAGMLSKIKVCCSCCCPREPIARVRSICFLNMFCALGIFVTTWSVVWSVFAYLLALAIATLSIVILLSLREPSSTSALAASPLVRNWGGFRISLQILAALIVLNSVAAITQSVYLIVLGCVEKDIFCLVLSLYAAYGFASVIAAVVMAGLTMGLISELNAIVRVLNSSEALAPVVPAMNLQTINQPLVGGSAMTSTNGPTGGPIVYMNLPREGVILAPPQGMAPPQVTSPQVIPSDV